MPPWHMYTHFQTPSVWAVTLAWLGTTVLYVLYISVYVLYVLLYVLLLSLLWRHMVPWVDSSVLADYKIGPDICHTLSVVSAMTVSVVPTNVLDFSNHLLLRKAEGWSSTFNSIVNIMCRGVNLLSFTLRG